MGESNAAKAKILIVEDDSFSQAILNMFLSRNYTTAVAENGTEAIELLQNEELPQLIISDINTPAMTGFELLKYLKANPLYQAIPFIVLCGDDSSEQKTQCLQEGAITFLVKPFNPIELAGIIQKALAVSN